MLRPSPNHGTLRLPNDDDDDDSYRQLAVRIVVIFNWLTIFCLAVFRLFTDLITNSIRLRTQPVTPE